MATIGRAVGRGGFNNPLDVRAVQALLNKSSAVSPKISHDGQYGKETHRAIIQFQMAAFPSNGSWDGLIEPTGKTLRALNNSHPMRLAPAHPTVVDAHAKAQSGHEPAKASAPSDKSALAVPQGQITFDAEGNDNPKSPFFSRQLHWPGGESGVTIGRGYDMRERTSAIIKKI